VYVIIAYELFQLSLHFFIDLEYILEQKLLINQDLFIKSLYTDFMYKFVHNHV